MITVNISGTPREMILNMYALEEIERVFGGMGPMRKRLINQRSRFRATMELAACLLTGAALARGHDPVTHSWLLHHLRTHEVGALFSAVSKCLERGMYSEMRKDKDKVRDLTLEEINLEKGTGYLTVRQIYCYGLSTGLSYSEMRALTPGFIMDMFAGRQEYIGSLFGGGRRSKRKPQRPDW